MCYFERVAGHKEDETNNEILQSLRAVLLAEEEISFAFLHGSFLDSPSLAHDIDVAVYIDMNRVHGQDLFDYTMRMSIDLTRQMGREIDVQTLNYAALGFKHSVFKYGHLLFSRDGDLMSEVIEQAVREYIDFYELSLDYLRDVIP